MRTITHDGYKFNEIVFDGHVTLDPVDDAPVSIMQGKGGWSVWKSYEWKGKKRKSYVDQEFKYPTKMRALDAAVTFLISQQDKY